MTLEQLLAITQFGTYITISVNDSNREFVYDLSTNTNSAFIDLLNYTVKCVYVDNNRLMIEI
jgi:hypothetical protein